MCKIFSKFFQQKKVPQLFALSCFVALYLFFPSSHPLAIESPTPINELQKPFHGDLSAMKGRHVIRALVTYSKTNFFILKGEPYGFEYDLLQAYIKWLNRNIKKGQLNTRMVFIPVPFDQLLEGLTSGKGDIAASGLTITPGRLRKISFTIPYVPNVEEIIVTRKKLQGLTSLDDLQGKFLYFAKGTSYRSHLETLNQQFQRKNMRSIHLKTVGTHLTTEDLLELTNSGAIDHMVADKHIAELWSSALPHIQLRPDLTIHQGGKIAWATRPNNPQLRKSLNSFLKKTKKERCWEIFCLNGITKTKSGLRIP